jgi:type IV secretion system protein VirB10
MTADEAGDGAPTDGPPGESAPPREGLRLRARPAPVTRINRRILIGAAAAVLLVISGVVMAALNPPRLPAPARKELIGVQGKAVADGIVRLPASYEGLRSAPKEAAPDAQAHTAEAAPSAGPADAGGGQPDARLAAPPLAGSRLAAEAAQSQIFFSLQRKGDARPDPPARPAPGEGEQTLGQAPAQTAAEPAAPEAPAPLHGAAEREAPATEAGEGARKLAFLKGAPEAGIYNPHALQKPVSPYQLLAGTVIAASLISGLNSDLPGLVIAAVTENVYDTVTGRHLLIPQTSRIVGKYDNVIAFGQARALVVWQRIILPDGSSLVIDNLPATDTSGYAGLADAVDLHTWRLLKGVALATLLGVGSQLALGSSSGESDLVKALQQSVQGTTNRAGQRLVERDLTVQPTITVRPGWPLRVIVHRDLVLRPYRGAPE